MDHPYMISALRRGERGTQKEDEVRKVAWIVYCWSVPHMDKGGVTKIRKLCGRHVWMFPNGACDTSSSDVQIRASCITEWPTNNFNAKTLKKADARARPATYLEGSLIWSGNWFALRRWPILQSWCESFFKSCIPTSVTWFMYFFRYSF